jgi:hypothetical protein
MIVSARKYQTRNKQIIFVACFARILCGNRGSEPRTSLRECFRSLWLKNASEKAVSRAKVASVHRTKIAIHHNERTIH